MILAIFHEFQWITDLASWSAFIWLGRVLGICFIPAVLLQRSTRPLSTLVWILVLYFLPYIGVVLWWMLGRNHMRRKKRSLARSRDQMARSFNELERRACPQIVDSDQTNVDQRDQALTTQRLVLRDEFNVFPPTRGNRVAIHARPPQAFDAFIDAIAEAEDHIHFLFYTWRDDETGTRFRDLLIEKAKQGIEVRVLFDGFGSVSIGRRFLRPLAEAGARVATFLPLHFWERRLRINFRNHRKLLVIDGRRAFTGGVNIADEYLQWFDMAYGFEGPVVYQMQEIFAEDWHFATGEDLAAERYFPHLARREPRSVTAPAPGDDDLIDDALARVVAGGPDDRLETIHKMFFLALTSARRNLLLITPYFVPDLAILTALQTAAMRGVDVRILVPGRSDVPLTQHAGRAYWESLMESGVRIFEYGGSILHAKLLVLDSTHVIVGSANMDIRSFRFNFEANAVIESRVLNRSMTEIFEDAQEKSDEVVLEEFRCRPRRARLIEGAARLFSPLL